MNTKTNILDAFKENGLNAYDVYNIGDNLGAMLAETNLLEFTHNTFNLVPLLIMNDQVQRATVARYFEHAKSVANLISIADYNGKEFSKVGAVLKDIGAKNLDTLFKDSKTTESKQETE